MQYNLLSIFPFDIADCPRSFLLPFGLLRSVFISFMLLFPNSSAYLRHIFGLLIQTQESSLCVCVLCVCVQFHTLLTFVVGVYEQSALPSSCCASGESDLAYRSLSFSL